MSLGTLSRLRKLGGDVLIRLDNRCGAMPGVAIGLDRRIGRLREGRVHTPPLRSGRAVIDGGADQGMSKAHSRSKREQAIGFGRTHRLAADPEGFGCSPEHDRIRSEEHTSELQSRSDLVCRLLLEKKKK